MRRIRVNLLMEKVAKNFQPSIPHFCNFGHKHYQMFNFLPPKSLKMFLTFIVSAQEFRISRRRGSQESCMEDESFLLAQPWLSQNAPHAEFHQSGESQRPARIKLEDNQIPSLNGRGRNKFVATFNLPQALCP